MSEQGGNPQPQTIFPGASHHQATEIIAQNAQIIDHLRAIRGWVGFMGAVLLIGIALGVAAALSASGT